MSHSPDTPLEISNSIIEHKTAYENIGKIPPPYRITCKEHKFLVSKCKELFGEVRYAKEVGYKYEPIKVTSKIAEYFGVRLEVVMIVDDYI